MRCLRISNTATYIASPLAIIVKMVSIAPLRYNSDNERIPDYHLSSLRGRFRGFVRPERRRFGVYHRLRSVLSADDGRGARARRGSGFRRGSARLILTDKPDAVRTTAPPTPAPP